MKITFIEPPNDLKLRYGKLAKIGALMPPLGIAYISAVLKAAGHQTEFIDPIAEEIAQEQLLERIKGLDSDLIGIPVFTTTYSLAKKLAAEIRVANPRVKILLGGPHCSGFPTETLKEIDADFVIFGEGEYPTLNLLTALEQNTDLAAIENLVYRKDGEVVQNKAAEFIRDLDALPLPDRDIFKLPLYHHSGEHRGKNILHLMTSRGCPWACAFCTTQETFGKKIRYRSPEKVFAEIKVLIEKYGADEIFFYDDTLTANKTNIIALCNLIIANNVKIIWGCYTRVDCVTPEILQLMARAGCYQINYGTESGVPRLLEIIKKGFKVEQSADSVRWTKEAGIETICNFILGLPSETPEESKQTIDFAIALDPDYVQFYLTMPYIGTPLYDIAKQHGTILTKSMEDYNRTPWQFVHYVTNGRTEKELSDLIHHAYKKFYLRPSYIIRRLNSLRKLPPRRMLNMIIAGLKMTVRK